MTEIDPPRHQHDYPDRFLQCEAAIETALATLIENAQASGWKSVEVSAAIIILADNHMLQQNSVAELNAYIDRLKNLKE